MTSKNIRSLSQNTPIDIPPYLPKSRFKYLPFVIAAGGRYDQVHFSSWLGAGLARWGTVTSVTFSKDMSTTEALPFARGQYASGEASSVFSISVGPLHLSFSTLPNLYKSRSYWLNITWFKPQKLQVKGASIAIGKSIRIVWFRYGSLLDYILRIEYYPCACYREPSLPGLPVSEARAGYYVEMMPVRSALVTLVVGAAAAITAAAVKTAPLLVPALLP
ncbi:MAG: hypothetical protein GXN93_01180 [Candidatus Diapherotrites archaeon]|nr:hypothetical protein [Candidatus Diapherotrites archaeon]